MRRGLFEREDAEAMLAWPHSALMALATRLIFVFLCTRGHAAQLHGAELEQIARNLYEGRGFSSPFEPH